MAAKYESVGTIRCEIGASKTLLFAPDADHCVKHEGQSIAIFVGKGRAVNAVRLPKGEVEVELLADFIWPHIQQAAVAAAARQLTVKVEVGPKFTLKKLTVTAKSTK